MRFGRRVGGARSSTATQRWTGRSPYCHSLPLLSLSCARELVLTAQVLGGRWKPLHYWYKALLFADVIATCGARGAFTCGAVAAMLYGALPIFTWA